MGDDTNKNVNFGEGEKEEGKNDRVQKQESVGSRKSLKSHLSQKLHMGPFGFFRDMCDKISVHGFGLIGLALADAVESHKEKKEDKVAFKFDIIKVITSVLVLLTSTGILIWYLSNILTSYMSTFLSIGLSDPQADLSKAYFPDVTICNNNLIKMSFLTGIDPALLNNKNLRKEIEEYFVTGSKAEPSVELQKFFRSQKFVDEIKKALPHKKKSITEKNAVNFFRQAAVPTCKDMIVTMYWKNEEVESTKLKEIVNDINATEATNFGICCNISPQKLFGNESSTKDMQGGPHEGISLLIDNQGWDYAYTPHYSEGVRFSASSPFSFNQIEQDGVFLEPGTNTYAAVSPRVTEIGSDRPLSYNWSPKQRMCYIGDMEKMPGMTDLQKKYPRLKNYDKSGNYEYNKIGDYDYRLCHELVKLDAIKTEAQCIPPELWEILNTDNTDALPDMDPCLGKNITMARDVQKKRIATIASHEDRICLRNCATQENNLYLSFSEYPAKAIFEEFPEYKLIQTRINDVLTKNTELINKYYNKKPTPKEYTETNLAWLTVYFKYPYVRAYTADVAKQRSSVVAEIGGTMGLFLGISFIGIIELFVHGAKIFMGWITPNKEPVPRSVSA